MHRRSSDLLVAMLRATNLLTKKGTGLRGGGGGRHAAGDILRLHKEKNTRLGGGAGGWGCYKRLQKSL